MLTFIIFYLSIGILSNFIGPLAKRLNKKNKVTKSSNITGSFKKPKVKNEEGLLNEIIFRTITILSFPILYAILMIDFFFIIRPRPWDHRLYYSNTAGEGKIWCRECNFEQNIVSFLHGVNDWNITGYQCQKCGKFHDIEYGLGNSEGRKCDCGGDLDREKPIFCPKCRTNNVSYLLTRIT